MPTSPDKKILIITAPSGAGKTSITRYLLQQFPELSFSISAATREKRSNEREGIDYYFMSMETFQEKIREQAFVEWEMVYEGKYYGTLRSELERIWKAGKIPLLDIDVKGAIHIQQQFPNSSLSIFIDPPSLSELHRRLAGRGTETPESLQARINKATFEQSFKQHFNSIILNEDLSKAQQEAQKLVQKFLSGT